MFFGKFEVADHENVGFKSIRCFVFEIFTKNDYFDNLTGGTLIDFSKKNKFNFL
jgi:hypothetical protein